jgi:endonuclease G
MRKLIISVIVILFCVLTSLAQDTITIKHLGYSTTYSKSLHYPVIVQWWETKAKDNCANPLPRKDQFAPDPKLISETKLQSDYDLANKTHKTAGLAGFDRGHMCPAASSECEGAQILTECFYFSNMAPQYHALNAGDWKSLETLERKIAIEKDSVHVWAGSIGVAEKFGTVSIPIKCWKVIYVVKTKEYQAYIFDNSAEKPLGLPHCKVQVTDVEKLTGFKFLMN